MKKKCLLSVFLVLLLLPLHVFAEEMLTLEEERLEGSVIKRVYKQADGVPYHVSIPLPNDEIKQKVSNSSNKLLEAKKLLTVYYIEQNMQSELQLLNNEKIANKEASLQIHSDMKILFESQKFDALSYAEEHAKKPVVPEQTPTKDPVIKEKEHATVYVVQQGDNLYKIAKNAGLTVDELMQLNNLTSDSLSIGQELILERKEVKTPITSTTPNKTIPDSKKEATSTNEKQKEPEKQTPPEENKVIIVEEKPQKSLDELSKEAIDEDLVVEVEEFEVTEKEMIDAVNDEPKKNSDLMGILSIVSILALAAIFTAGVVYWKRKWFLK